jgi:hypothetical protein
VKNNEKIMKEWLAPFWHSLSSVPPLKKILPIFSRISHCFGHYSGHFGLNIQPFWLSFEPQISSLLTSVDHRFTLS